MPKTVSNRQLRRTVVQQQHALEEGFAPALRAVVQNEAKTRARVDRLEEALDDVGRVAGKAHAMATPRPTLIGRLRWLVTGH